MIVFFAILVLSVYFAFKWTPGRRKVWDYIHLSAIGISVGFLIGLMAAMLIGAIINEVNPNAAIQYPDEVTYLANLQDNVTLEGSFFLGMGTIEGNMRYMFYEKIGENNFHFESISTEDVEISFDDGPPRIVLYRWEFPQGSLAFMFGLSTKNKKVIYVPEGTIKENFRLDAK